MKILLLNYHTIIWISLLIHVISIVQWSPITLCWTHSNLKNKNVGLFTDIYSYLFCKCVHNSTWVDGTVQQSCSPCWLWQSRPFRLGVLVQRQLFSARRWHFVRRSRQNSCQFIVGRCQSCSKSKWFCVCRNEKSGFNSRPNKPLFVHLTEYDYY